MQCLEWFESVVRHVQRMSDMPKAFCSTSCRDSYKPITSEKIIEQITNVSQEKIKKTTAKLIEEYLGNQE